MRHIRPILMIIAALAAITACGDDGGEAEAPETLTLLAHDSFAGGVGDDTFAPFTAETGIEVEVIAGGDAGAMVNQAVLSKDNPIADVIFGIDDTFLSRALDEEVFSAHQSELADDLVPGLAADTDMVTPIDYGDVCFNYDKAWFADSQLAIPTDLDDLKGDRIAPLITVEHPATSSPGLAFLLATVGVYGENEWIDWWVAARDNGIDVAADWDTAYYGDFTRYGGGRPIVMSYASSPPAEVVFAEEPLDEAPTGVIESGCYRQVEYAGILSGTAYPESAGRLVDYMLSVGFQEQIPLTWFVFPANAEAGLPQVFIDHTTIPADPIRLDADVIAANRDRWIDEWISVMEG